MNVRIRKTTDPILRKACEKVDAFDFEFQKLVDDLIDTMRKHKGIGLAAPQIGSSKKVFVVEFEGDKEVNLPGFPLTVISNPEITHQSKNAVNMVEGCLSFPQLELLIKRPADITIKGKDRYGKNIKIEASKLYARAIQHEFDHLNSTLLIDHLQKIKVIFIGTGTLGLKSLEMLSKDAQFEILSVATSDPKTIISRNKQEKSSPILDLSQKLKLPVIKTKNINDPESIKKISQLKPDLGVMADFGQIVSQKVLDIPKYGIINIHPSLLPKHRGPAPVQQTILDGDEKTGVSLILTSNKMDAGGIISQVVVELTGAETSTILKNYLGEVGATLLLNSIPYYIAGDLKPTPQNDELASYTKMISAGDALVDNNSDPVTVERKIRAFDIWPKVYAKIKNKRVQLLESHFGKEGEFVIDRVKPEGKKEMSYEEYLRGHKDKLTFK